MQDTIQQIQYTGTYNGYNQFKCTLASGVQVESSDKENPPKFFAVGDVVEVQEKWVVKGGANKGLKAVSFKRVQGGAQGGSPSAPYSGATKPFRKASPEDAAKKEHDIRLGRCSNSAVLMLVEHHEYSGHFGEAEQQFVRDAMRALYEIEVQVGQEVQR